MWSLRSDFNVVPGGCTSTVTEFQTARSAVSAVTERAPVKSHLMLDGCVSVEV